MPALEDLFPGFRDQARAARAVFETRFRGVLAFGWLLPVLLFAGLAAYGIEDPGLFRDEASNALMTLRLMKLEGGAWRFFDVFIEFFFGSTVPRMQTAYEGSHLAYLYLLPFTIFEPSVLVLRTTNIMVGVLILILGYVCAAHLFDRTAALAGCLLAAVDPTFVFALRHDWAVIGLPILCNTAVLALLSVYFSSPKRGLLIGACFLMGLGLWIDATTGWFLAGLLPALWAFKMDWRTLRERHGTGLLWCAAAFLLGGLPFFWASLGEGGIFGIFFQTDLHHSERAVPYGLGLVYRHWALMLDMLSGRGIQRLALGSWGPKTWLPFLWALGIAATFWGLRSRQVSRRPAAGERGSNLLFLGCLSLVSALACILTPPVWGVHHFIVALCPSLHFFAAASLLRAFKYPRAWVVFARVLLLAHMLLSVRVVAYIHARFASRETNPIFSPVIYDVAGHVRRGAPEKVVCLDWGFCDSVAFLTRLPYERAEDVARQRGAQSYWMSLFSGNNLYLMYSNATEKPHSGRRFLEMAARAGRRPVLEAEYLLRPGVYPHAIRVYSLAAPFPGD